MLHHAKEELRLYNAAVKESYLLPATNDEFELLTRSVHISSLEADLIFADHEIAFEAIEDYQKKSEMLFNKFTNAVKKIFAKFKVVLLQMVKILDAKGKACEKMYENAKDKIGKNGVFKTACGKYNSEAKPPVLNQAGLNWLGGQCDKFIALNRTLNKSAAEYQSKIKNVPNINNKDDLPKLDAFNEEILAVVKTLYSNYKKDCPESMAVTIDETKPSIAKLKDEEVAKLYSKYLFPAGDDTAVIDKAWLEAALTFIKKCISMAKTAIGDAINALDKANVVCDDIRKVTKPLLERFTDPKDKKVAARSAAKLNKSFKSFGNVVKTHNQKMFSLFSMTKKVFSIFESSLKWYTGKGEKSETKTEEKTENTENQQSQNANAGAGESFGMYDYDLESYFYEHLSEEEKFNERYCRKALMAIDEFVNLEFNDDLVRRYGREGIGEKIMDFIRKIWDWICGLFGKSKIGVEKGPTIDCAKLKQTYEKIKDKIDSKALEEIKKSETCNRYEIILDGDFFANGLKYFIAIGKLKQTAYAFVNEQLNNKESAPNIIADFSSWIGNDDKFKEYLGENGKASFNAKTCQIDGNTPLGKKFNEEFLAAFVKKVNEDGERVKEYLTAGQSNEYSLGNGAGINAVMAKFGCANKKPVKISESNLDVATLNKLIAHTVLNCNLFVNAMVETHEKVDKALDTITAALKTSRQKVQSLRADKNDTKMAKVLPFMKALAKCLATIANIDKGSTRRIFTQLVKTAGFVNRAVILIDEKFGSTTTEDKNDKNKPADNQQNNGNNSGGNENYHNASRITAKENTNMKFNSFFKLFGEEPVLVYPELGREDSLYLQELEADMAYADKMLSGDIHIGQEGFFESIKNFIAKIWEAICNFFNKLFGGDGSGSSSVSGKTDKINQQIVSEAKKTEEVIVTINKSLENLKKYSGDHRLFREKFKMNEKEMTLGEAVKEVSSKIKNLYIPTKDLSGFLFRVSDGISNNIANTASVISAYVEANDSAINICSNVTESNSWIFNDDKSVEYLGSVSPTAIPSFNPERNRMLASEMQAGEDRGRLISGYLVKNIQEKLIDPIIEKMRDSASNAIFKSKKPIIGMMYKPAEFKSVFRKKFSDSLLNENTFSKVGDVGGLIEAILKIQKAIEENNEHIKRSGLTGRNEEVKKHIASLRKIKDIAEQREKAAQNFVLPDKVTGAPKVRNRFKACYGYLAAISKIIISVAGTLTMLWYQVQGQILMITKGCNRLATELTKIADAWISQNTKRIGEIEDIDKKKQIENQNEENKNKITGANSNVPNANGTEHFSRTKRLEFADPDMSSIRELESYTKLFIHNGYYPGTEGFYDSALRLLTGVSNIVYRTLTNAKIVYRAFRGLKRTEIHSYQDRYAATIFRVKKLSYPEVSEVMIPRPKGLSTTYLEVTNALIACLNTCDMVNRAKSFAHASKSVMEQITDGAAPTAIAGIMGNHDNEIRQITGLYEKASACLSDKGMGVIPFGKGFSSMDEYSSVQKLLDDNCKFEYDATKVYGYLEDCTANMDKVIQSVKSIKNGNIIIGKNDIANLSDTCLLMAKTFDIYGLCIQDFNRVEHNFVEATKTVVNHFKL